MQTDFQDEKEAFHKYMEKFGECRDGSNPGQFLMVSTEFESVPRTYTAQIAYIMHMPSYNTYVYIYTSSTAQGGEGSFKNRKPIDWLL